MGGWPDHPRDPRSCEQFSIAEEADGTPRATRDYLYADAAVECGTEAHEAFERIASGLILLWPIGVPALFASLLHIASREATTASPLWRATSFLHGEYRHEYRWWEVLELMRKLTLTGFLFLVPQRLAIVRMIVAILVSICHTALLPVASPYKQPSTMLVAIVASVTLVCTLNFAMLVRMYNELERQQMDTSGFFGALDSVLPLAMIIFGFNMVVLGAASALFAYQVRIERRSYSVRRLRYNDGGEVSAPSLQAGLRYHLFLSHIWGTGQDQMRIVKQRMLEMLPGVRVFLGASAGHCMLIATDCMLIAC